MWFTVDFWPSHLYRRLIINTWCRLLYHSFRDCSAQLGNYQHTDSSQAIRLSAHRAKKLPLSHRSTSHALLDSWPTVALMCIFKAEVSFKTISIRYCHPPMTHYSGLGFRALCAKRYKVAKRFLFSGMEVCQEPSIVLLLPTLLCRLPMYKDFSMPFNTWRLFMIIMLLIQSECYTLYYRLFCKRKRLQL